MQRHDGNLGPGKARLLGLACLLAAMSWAQPLHAHGSFEIRYAPPIPGWLFLLGGAGVVALTFLMVAWRRRGVASVPARAIHGAGPWLRAFSRLGAAFGLSVAGLIVAAALMVDPRSERSFAPVFVWTGWWMGLTWIVLVLGNVWPALDPWNALRRLWGRAFSAPWSLDFRFPERLATVPALLALIAFAWFELAWFRAQEAGGVLDLLIVFSAWLWLGMLVFRPGEWWENANPFTRYFAILGRFGCAEAQGTRLELRPLGSGLTRGRARHRTEAAFVIVILFLVTFDGFVATPEWWLLLRAMMSASYAIAPKSLAYHGAFLCAMILGALVFTAGYGAVCRLMARLGRGAQRPGEMVREFALTLLPIAAAYHVAHFLPAVPSRLSRLLRAASDPLQKGWDLFGTAHLDWAIIWTPTAAAYLWLTQTGLIVAGHAYAIAIAHAKALALFEERGRAIRVGLPLTALMIGYTVISLWIISRPILDQPLVPIPGLTP